MPFTLYRTPITRQHGGARRPKAGRKYPTRRIYWTKQSVGRRCENPERSAARRIPPTLRRRRLLTPCARPVGEGARFLKWLICDDVACLHVGESGCREMAYLLWVGPPCVISLWWGVRRSRPVRFTADALRVRIWPARPSRRRMYKLGTVLRRP